MLRSFLISLVAFFPAAIFCSDPASASALNKINHIVVLMLENRSFDNMLGNLYPKSDQFDGLNGDESNFFANEGTTREIKVWNELDSNRPEASRWDLPAIDPGESFDDMNEQLFGTNAPSAHATSNMSGFAQNYFQYTQPAPPDDIMHYYLPKQVPVLSWLAKNYAVCDAWFASAPCQTWPNRFFVHTATAGGYENNTPLHFPYQMSTIFTRFNQLNYENGWKIYYHDFPQSLVLSDLWFHMDQFHSYSQFKEDAANGNLPAYSFIEPRFFADSDFPSDQHPPHDVQFGEELIADIYNTLQASPAWENTMFIIIYDEHGGCYDHVSPPSAVPPEPAASGQTFSFDRYGVRIPAVIISPYIAPGTIFRAPKDSQPFDHTSVIATLRRRFNLGSALTQRDANAPDLSLVLTLSEPLNIGEPLSLPSINRSAELLQKVKDAGLSDFQKSLHAIAAYVPDLSKIEGEAAQLEGIVENAVSEIAESAENLISMPNSHDDILSYIRDKLNAIFHWNL